MDWKVVARGGRPSPETVELLCRLTGLRRDEVLLSLGRDGVVAGARLSEEKAQSLGDRLSRDRGIACRILPDGERKPERSGSRVLLTGYRSGYRSRLRMKLQELTGLPPEKVTLWLAKVPIVLSRNADSLSAERIRRAVESAGGIVRTVSEEGGEQEPPASDGSAVFSLGTGDPRRQGPPVVSDVRARATGAQPTAKGSPGSDSPDGGSAPLETEPPEKTPLIPGCRVDPPPTGWIAAGDGIAGGPPPVFHAAPPHMAGDRFGEPPLRTITDESSVSPPPPEFSFSKPPVLVLTLPPLPGQPTERETGPIPEIAFQWAPPMRIDPDRLLPPVVEYAHPAEYPGGIQDQPPVIVFRRHAPAVRDETPPEEILHEEAPPEARDAFRTPEVRESAPRSPAEGPVEAPPVRRLKLVDRSDPDGSDTVGTVSRPPGTVRRRRKRRKAILVKPPSASTGSPPEKASFHLYLCAPAAGAEREIAEALTDVLGLPTEVSAALVRECPAWLAGFEEGPRARSIARMLEDRGVTVSIVRGSLGAGGEITGSAPGFSAWLASNG